jgi:predicted DNA-binding protein
MGYIRFKLPDEIEEILDKLSTKLGMKKSEITRIAVIDYLKSISMISEKAKEKEK